MGELHDAVFRAGVWQVIEQRAKELKDEAKQELQGLEVGDAVAGRFDGQVIAKATKTKGRAKLIVSDDEGFAQWVASRWPTEVLVQQVVNGAFLKVLEKDALDKGALIDEVGDVCPFVEVVAGEPFVSVRREKDAPFIVAQLLSQGRLSLDGVRELESVEDRADSLRAAGYGQ